MIYIILTGLVLPSIFLYLLIELKKSRHLIYVSPLSLFFVAGSYLYLDKLFGYPVSKTNETKFRLIAFDVNEDQEKIYFWILLENEEQPKAIFLPYSPDMHKKLQKMSQQMNEGAEFEGEFKDGEDQGEEKKKQRNNNDGSDLIFHELDVPHYLPDKDGN